MINIYEDINKLQATFRKTDEFENLQKAVDAVREDEEAKKLFTNFRDVQMKLQDKQNAGEEITEEEYVYLQKVAQLAQQDLKILAMLEAEMALSSVIQEVNRIITQPIQSLYDGL
ncbi:YlbF family regulator [Solibacillus daqui]|uniref:YlbF family regulator n=1 Tax=Solibacillus daqui TaxID=2912187 RepID=UPI002366BF73|nr:YlbF family regulator [Solibacillus daqui]